MRERGRQAAGHRDAGVTLIELLITMIVLVMGSVLALQVTVGLVRNLREVRLYSDTLAAVRLGLGSMERQIRSGDVLFNPVSEAAINPDCAAWGTQSGSCMRVYTQVDGLKRCVQWQIVADPAVAGTALMRSRSFSPTWSTDGDVGAWRTVARGLTPPSAAVAPFTLSSTSSAYSNRLLSVRLIALDAGRSGRDTTIETALSGRGTVYGGDASLCSPGPA